MMIKGMFRIGKGTEDGGEGNGDEGRKGSEDGGEERGEWGWW